MVKPVEAIEPEKFVEAENLAIAVMLLGSVGFMMGIFYIVNYPDEDIKRSGWSVISSTISIFSAVMLFQACHGIIEEYCLEGMGPWFVFFISTLEVAFWFFMLQFLLALLSGAVCVTPPKTEEELVRARLSLKCWAVLMGHITGFASIACFCQLQQLVPRNLICTFLCIPFCWGVLSLIHAGTERLRRYASLFDDDEIDEHEEVWMEATEETEDDITGLAVSFMLTQWLRFAISGVLPGAEGLDETWKPWTTGQVATLYGIGLGLVILNGCQASLLKQARFPERAVEQMDDILAMSFAWCLFYGTLSYLTSNYFTTEQSRGMTMQMAEALIMTIMAFVFIFLLDKVADQGDLVTEELTMELRALAQSLAILIGFSWEKAFDTGVEAVVEYLKGRESDTGLAWGKLLMTLGISLVVIPAWRMYILPLIEAMDKEAKLEEEELQQALAATKEEEEGESHMALPGLVHGFSTAKGKRSLFPSPLKKANPHPDPPRKSIEQANFERQLEANLRNCHNLPVRSTLDGTGQQRESVPRGDLNRASVQEEFALPLDAPLLKPTTPSTR